MRYSCTFVLASLSLLAACSSATKPTSDEKNLLGNAVMEDKVYGAELPQWTNISGIKEGRVYSVGYAEFSLEKAEHYTKKASHMDAEVKLLSDAPSDFRVLTQNSLTGAGLDSGEYMQIQSKLSEVIGVQGIKAHDETCRKVLRHTPSQSVVMRGCWSSVSASVSDLQKAYALTLKKKYGLDVSAKFENLMSKELDAITNAENRKPSAINEKQE